MPYRAWLYSAHSGLIAGICKEKNVKHQFCDALRAVRLAKQLSQDELGIPQSHASRLENGQKIPSWERVEALAEMLGVHPLTLFTLAYAPTTNQQTLSELSGRVQSEITEVAATLRQQGHWPEEP